MRVGKEAIAGLEPLGDDAGLAKAWWLVSEAHSIAGHWQQRADALERALAHARRGGSGEAAGLVALLAQALYYGPTPGRRGPRPLPGVPRGGRRRPRARGGAAQHTRRAQCDARRVRRGPFPPCARGGDLRRDGARVPPRRALADRRGDRDTRRRRGRSGAGARTRLRDPRADGRARPPLDADGLSSHERWSAQERFDEAEEKTRYSEETAGADDLVTQVVWRSTRAVVLAHRGELAPAESLAKEATALVGRHRLPRPARVGARRARRGAPPGRKG